MRVPLKFMDILTEHRILDIMHRRAGRDERPPYWRSHHGDAHKYCPLGRCGSRPGPYHADRRYPTFGRSAKITAWRKAKAYANRRYLEGKWYGHSTTSI